MTGEPVEWELRRCDECGHENIRKLRRENPYLELDCGCGSRDFSIYDLAAELRPEIPERVAFGGAAVVTAGGRVRAHLLIERCDDTREDALALQAEAKQTLTRTNELMLESKAMRDTAAASRP